ncbi:helix-turn-helix domain-containing protein [Xenorhabdus bharatensis]|uniref:helix-turn-helix domain-containing protein n=1 Tax=Xenorhabdus bharatensis TaxID=3136256 RepID=UPI0030F49F6A
MSSAPFVTVFAAEDHLTLIGTDIDTHAHKHTFLQLLISLDGKPITVTISGKTLRTKSILINSNIIHDVTLNNRFYWLTLINHTSPLGLCLKHQLINGKVSYLVLDYSKLASECKAISAQYISLHEKTYLAYWNNLHRKILTQTCNLNHTIADNRLKAILGHLIFSQEIYHSVLDISAKTPLSPSRLSHLFSEKTGGNLKNYILFHQLINALFLITEGKKVTDAAMQCDFDSASHLSSTARKLMGIKPSFAKKISGFLKVFSS